MRIDNKSITIKTKNKSFEFHNEIFNNYLSKLALRQVSETPYEDLRMAMVYIKFEEIINIKEKNIDDYDVHLNADYSIVTTNQIVTAQYNYSSSEILNYGNNLKDYANKQITALAFGSHSEIFAAVDVSSFNIFLDNISIFNITRTDILSLDGISNDIPYHICPHYEEDYISIGGKLHSIGLGSSKELIEEEHILTDDDIEIVEETENEPASFFVSVEKGVDDTQFPINILYPQDNIYPMPFAVLSPILFPNTDVYSENNVYPSKSDFKYVIFKYQVYSTLDGALNRFYTVSFYTEKKGQFKIKTHYKEEKND